MKRLISELILDIYHYYQDDSISATEDKRKEFVKSALKEFLFTYNFCYKSESYKNENEIRLICYIAKDLKNWTNFDDSNMSLYFEKGVLWLKLGRSCLFDYTQTPSIYHCRELNKSTLTGDEIREVLKKRIAEEQEREGGK